MNDPAEMQKMILERYRQMLEVTSDDEWAAIKPLVQKVMEARMASFAGMGRGMMGEEGQRPRQAGRAMRDGFAQHGLGPGLVGG